MPSGRGDAPGQGVVGDLQLECEVELSVFHGSQHSRCAAPAIGAPPKSCTPMFGLGGV